jgi:hypothetical protein
MKEVLKIVIRLLRWTDNHINHAIIEELLEYLPQENKVTYFFQDCCFHFCQWVNNLYCDNFSEDENEIL